MNIYCGICNKEINDINFIYCPSCGFQVKSDPLLYTSSSKLDLFNFGGGPGCYCVLKCKSEYKQFLVGEISKLSMIDEIRCTNEGPIFIIAGPDGDGLYDTIIKKYLKNGYVLDYTFFADYHHSIKKINQKYVYSKNKYFIAYLLLNETKFPHDEMVVEVDPHQIENKGDEQLVDEISQILEVEKVSTIIGIYTMFVKLKALNARNLIFAIQRIKKMSKVYYLTILSVNSCFGGKEYDRVVDKIC